MIIKYLILICIFFCVCQIISDINYSSQLSLKQYNDYKEGLELLGQDNNRILVEYPLLMPTKSINPLFEFEGFCFMDKFIPQGCSLHSNLYKKKVTQKGLNSSNILKSAINNPNFIILSHISDDFRIDRINYLKKYLNQHYSQDYGNRTISIEPVKGIGRNNIDIATNNNPIKFYRIITEKNFNHYDK